MPTTKVLAILTLTAATLGTTGCRTCGQVGEFVGVVLGTAAAVALDSGDSESDSEAIWHYEDTGHDDDHHDEHHERHCPRHR